MYTMCILIIRYLRLNSPFCTDGLGLLCLLHSKGCSSSCMKEGETEPWVDVKGIVEVGGDVEVEGNGEVEEFLKYKNQNGYIGLKQFC